MPNLFAMSFEGQLAPSFDLKCLNAGKPLPDGWGLGYYPGGEPSASVLKEAAPPHESMRSDVVRAWEHLESSLFLLHIRNATWGSISDANTQPFSRSWAGRDWLLSHSGSLQHRVEVSEKSLFQPVGSTDTETVFCELMNGFLEKGYKSIADVDLHALRQWFADHNEYGGMNLVLTDGRDLCVYSDRSEKDNLFVWTITPPYGNLSFGDEDLEINLTKRGIKSRKGVIVCSSRLQPTCDCEVNWKPVEPGTLLVIRQGAIQAEIPRPRSGSGNSEFPLLHKKRAPIALPGKSPSRTFDVLHRTVYRYDSPVERSTHMLRLSPMHDRLQHVLDSSLTVSVDGHQQDYDDVFGNRVRRLLIDTPFTEMIIEAKSKVRLLDSDPFGFRPRHVRSSIPLVWMPWQRHMLDPYLLPLELPQTQLEELADYAMSFVERNDYDLVDTLLDMNLSIFLEYEYCQGSTTLATTPFEVYTNRRGVCQDFSNLLICLARLLGVPARYVCGYIYTGFKNPNQVQSEASHAWVQVYLPEVGWKGFDPTNGILTQTDHVRVAVGRNYIDATPTSGTIFVGGGRERLEVDVRVEPCE